MHSWLHASFTESKVGSLKMVASSSNSFSRIYFFLRKLANKLVTITKSNPADIFTEANVVETPNDSKVCLKRDIVCIVLNVLLFLLVVVFIICVYRGMLPQHQLGYFCNDKHLSFEYRGYTIAYPVLLLVCYLGPIAILTLVEVLTVREYSRVRLKVIWSYYKPILIGITMNFALTAAMSIIVGECRPDFFHVCKPDVECEGGAFVKKFHCTNKKLDRIVLLNSYRSFPSVHGNLSVYASICCAYIIQTRVSAAQLGSVAKLFLVTSCTTWGLICSLTAITDRRNHWWDVLFGAFMGMIGSIFCLIAIHLKLKERNQSQVT